MARKKQSNRRRISTAGMILAQARRSLGWSIDDLAHHSGVSNSGIVKQENGHRHEMRRATARVLSDTLTKAGFPVTEGQLLGR